MGKHAGQLAKTGKAVKGPAGTASQRATKQGAIKGRMSAAKAAMHKSPQRKLPDSQGT